MKRKRECDRSKKVFDAKLNLKQIPKLASQSNARNLSAVLADATSATSTEAPNKQDLVAMAPPEVAVHMFSFFRPRELLIARQVSREWKRRIDEDFSWEDKLRSLGVKPINHREQFYASLTVLQVCVKSIYHALISYLEYASIADGEEFYNLTGDIADQHFLARTANLSTYALFNAVLAKINSECQKELREKAYALILYYLLDATEFTKNSINLDFVYGGYTGVNFGMAANDYRDIMILIKKLLAKNIVDLDKSYGGWYKSPALEFLVDSTFRATSRPRPSPSIVRLLIESGANFNLSLSRDVAHGFSLMELLIINETVFHAQYNETLPVESSVKSVGLYHETLPVEIESSVKNLYLKEYGKFIGTDNLASTAKHPLPKEFLNMAETFFRHGGELSTYENFNDRLLQLDRENEAHLSFMRGDHIPASLAKRFQMAFKQLERLQNKICMQSQYKNSMG